MIKSSALSELLKKSIENGIDSVFITKISGEILCIEGNETNQTVTDVISSIWTEYSPIGADVLKENLTYLIIENEDSNVITTNLYGYIITMKAGIKMPLGLLKLHLTSLANFLNKKLEPYKDILIPRGEK